MHEWIIIKRVTDEFSRIISPSWFRTVWTAGGDGESEGGGRGRRKDVKRFEAPRGRGKKQDGNGLKGKQVSRCKTGETYLTERGGVGGGLWRQTSGRSAGEGGNEVMEEKEEEAEE